MTLECRRRRSCRRRASSPARRPARGRRSRLARGRPRTPGPRARRSSAATRSTTWRRTSRRRRPGVRHGRSRVAGETSPRRARRRRARARGGRRPDPARELRLDPHPERARDGVDARPRWRAARREGSAPSASATTAPIAAATSGRGRPAASHTTSADEPQRNEVEPVAVVEPVVAPRGAREAATTSRPETLAEAKRLTNARPARPARPARQGHEHDRGDRDRHDREVDGEVAEVVHEPLADRERVVAAPELPVGAERVLGRAPEASRGEREDGEDHRQRGRPETQDSARPFGRVHGAITQKAPSAPTHVT